MAEVTVYQLRIYLRKISPLIWRRLLVRSDSSVADLHYALQIVMNWTDFYLHQFRIRGKRYGVGRLEGPWFQDRAEDVRLDRFQFRPRERFLYEYNFFDQWEHEIRVEKILPLDPDKTYPRCIGGANAAPPEDCGGPERFLALKHHFNEGYIWSRLLEMIDEHGPVGDYREERHTFLYWAGVGKYNRRTANKRLKLYAAGDDEWRYE
jgi:hypothetical protein